jgi:hypothetical protein
MIGRQVAISIPRRLVVEAMRLSNEVADVAMVRRMKLGAVVAARAANPARPPWTAIFVKAMALVADEVPSLRQTFVRFPTAHFYEYSSSVAAMAIEREFDGEPAVFLGFARNPSAMTLADIAGLVRFYSQTPVTEVRDFSRAIKAARRPALIRRLILWFGYQLPRIRANYYGTFLVSAVSGLGADATRARIVTTSLLHCGQISAEGPTDVHLVFDHRLIDGLGAARILERLEQVLNGTIVDELSR